MSVRKCAATVTVDDGPATHRVAIVAISYIARRDGVSVYIESLLAALLAGGDDGAATLDVDVYACGEAGQQLERRLAARMPEKGRCRVRLRVFASAGDGPRAKYLHIPRQVRRGGYDAVVLPNLQPVWLPRGRTVAILHDLTYRVAGSHFPFWRRAYMDLLTRLWIARAGAIGCISQTSEADLRHYYAAGSATPRLQLPNGLPEKIAARPRPGADDVVRTLTANTIELVFVGRLNRLKGFDRVCRLCEWLDAYCAEQRVAARVHVVGKDTAESVGLLADLRCANVTVARHGYLDDDALDALYRRSAFCLFFSRNEGFGLPVLEGIWQGCVPLLSDIAIFREVMGPGYPLFADDPHGCAATIAFIHRLRTDSGCRDETLARMECALTRWEGGYTRAARALLDWVRTPAARGEMA